MAQEPAESVASSSKTILESDNDVYFDETIQKLVASGNARLQSGNILLTANRIEFDRNQSIATASGKVILTDGEIRLLSKDLSVSLISGDFNATDVKTMLYPLAIKAEQIVRKDFVITGIDSSLYFLDKVKNEPNLNLKTVKINQKENTFEVAGIVAKIGDQWVGTLPSFSGKTKHNPWRYKLKAGDQRNLGWYLGAGGKWELNPTIDFNFETTSYSKRGWLFSPGFNWSDQENDTWGEISTGWINDQGKKLGNDLRGVPINSDRSYVRGYTLNQLDQNWQFTGQFEYNNDSDVYRDFQRDQFYQNQWNDSFGEVSYQSDHWTLSTLARWQANEHESIVEQLPTTRFDLHPIAWMHPDLYHRVTLEFSSFRKKDDYGNLFQESKKFDMGYEIVRPFRLSNGFIYTPHFAFRRQDYSLVGHDASRTFGEIANELRFEVFGDYDWKNTIWEIDQLRHVMSFSISHRLINRISADQQSNIPIIDDPFIDINLRSIDLMDHIQADGLKPYEVVRLGWENEFLTRDERNTRSLASIAFFNDLYYDEKESDSESKEFFSDLTLYPAHWLSFKAQSKFDLDSGDAVRNSFSTRITDGIINQVEIGYFKYLTFSDQWRINTSHRMDNTKNILSTIAYDAENDRIPFWQASIEYKTSPFWTWILSVSGREGTAKENEMEIALSTRIFAF